MTGFEPYREYALESFPKGFWVPGGIEICVSETTDRVFLLLTETQRRVPILLPINNLNTLIHRQEMSPSELTTTEEPPQNPQTLKDIVSPSSSGYKYPSSAAETRLVQHEEYQYLNLIRYILTDGESRPDRTGTGTLSIFAPPQLRFSLRDNVFPLLTTKRVFFRAVLEELLWFVKADTNALHLSERGVKIWDGNGSREYLDSIGLKERKVGDLGPVYGFQWRHFGAEYVDCETDYTGQGIDQLAEVINKVKNAPYDRRIIMSAWNPSGTTKRPHYLSCSG